MTQRGLNWAPSHDAGLTWSTHYNTNLKVEPLANKQTRTKEIEVWYQQYNRRITL